VWLWDLAAAKPAHRALAHPAPVDALVFHPAGTLLFSGAADRRIRTWDAGRGVEVAQPLVQPAGVVGLDITSDGRTLLAVVGDGRARLWDRATGRAVGVLIGGRAALGADRIAAAAGGEVRVHLLARPLSRPLGEADQHVLPADALTDEAIAYIADGLKVLTVEDVPGRARGLARLRDAKTGRPVGRPWLHAAVTVDRLALAPSGKVVATACHRPGRGSTVELWDATTGRSLHRLPQRTGRVRCLAFDPAGKVLAAGEDGLVRRYAVESGREIAPPQQAHGLVLALAFDPGGTGLAVAATTELLVRGKSLQQHGPVRCLAFDRTGRFLLAGGPFARLWDLERGAPRTRLAGGVSIVRPVDGRVVLLASTSRSVRRMDLARGEIVAPTIRVPADVLSVALSPDGRLLLAGLADGSARLWDLAGTSRLLGPPAVHGSPVRGVFFEPGGKWFLTTGSDGTTRRWPVPQAGDEGSADDLVRQVEALTGQVIDGTTEPTLLLAATWEKRRAGVRLASTATVETWHDARARDAELDGDLFAARWHLDTLIRLRRDDSGLYQRRAVVHARAGDFTRAAADLDQAARLAGGERITPLENALATCQAARAWKAAVWCAERLLEARPDDARLKEEREAARRMMGQGRGD
jgi:WD40 repeat protein